jgi:competence ComEA-like helix-hairpin-helix protein
MQPKNQNTIKDYFTFTPKERRAIFLLSLVVIILFILPHLAPFLFRPKREISVEKTVNGSADTPVVWKKDIDPRNNSKHSLQHEGKETALFYFDPNTADLNTWLQLGVRQKTAATILRYRMKGGRFKSPQDIKKIWGFSPSTADRLIPYVRIKENSSSSDIREKNKTFLSPKRDKTIILDINKASKEDWESLSGIGAVLAGRIIAFREKLGGFISVEQVGETYGLHDTTFQKIIPLLSINESNIQLLNINRLNIEQLSRHPYIKYRTAKAIVAYREQHGSYRVVEDLKKVESISYETYQKVAKYLTTE